MKCIVLVEGINLKLHKITIVFVLDTIYFPNGNTSSTEKSFKQPVGSKDIKLGKLSNLIC